MKVKQKSKVYVDDLLKSAVEICEKRGVKPKADILNVLCALLVQSDIIMSKNDYLENMSQECCNNHNNDNFTLGGDDDL